MSLMSLSLPQDTVSVHRPGFYADRFFKFMSSNVFKKSSCEFNLHPLTRRGLGEKSSDANVRCQAFVSFTAEPWQEIRHSCPPALLGAASCHVRVKRPFDPCAVRFHLLPKINEHTNNDLLWRPRADVIFSFLSLCVFTSTDNLNFLMVLQPQHIAID